MKFALVNGEKTTATKGAKGVCAVCESDVIAKCGELKVHHWAHKGHRNCDVWWENETEWHRKWKELFPEQWQEVVHYAEHGEKHIADVKTDAGWALEFQHSYIDSEERRARTTFYERISWVVDGQRRKRDGEQFRRILRESRPISPENPVYRVNFPEECRLLREWCDCGVPVFFDFPQMLLEGEAALWMLLPIKEKGAAYLIQFKKAGFVDLHRRGRFEQVLEWLCLNTVKRICHQRSRPRVQVPIHKLLPARRLRRRRRL